MSEQQQADEDEGEHRHQTTAAVVNEASREKVDRLADTVDKDWRQNVNLKLWYATAALVALVVQVGLADWVFVRYAQALEWRVPTPAIAAWLGATVIHVLGITITVTRGLFPPGKAR